MGNCENQQLIIWFEMKMGETPKNNGVGWGLAKYASWLMQFSWYTLNLEI